MKLAEHKKTLIISSLLILFPILIGLLLWNQLPEQIATHFNSAGQPDDYSPKLFAVAGLPLFLLFAHWIGISAIFADPRKNNISGKSFGLFVWVIPITSLIMCSATYFNALGISIDFLKLSFLLGGILFILIGNYLPKCAPNYSIGFKLPWTLEDEENWAKTHRLAGYIWLVLGLFMIIGCFMEWYWIFFAVLCVGVIVPTVYSYTLYVIKNKNS